MYFFCRIDTHPWKNATILMPWLVPVKLLSLICRSWIKNSVSLTQAVQMWLEHPLRVSYKKFVESLNNNSEITYFDMRTLFVNFSLFWVILFFLNELNFQWWSTFVWVLGPSGRIDFLRWLTRERREGKTHIVVSWRILMMICTWEFRRLPSVIFWKTWKKVRNFCGLRQRNSWLSNRSVVCREICQVNGSTLHFMTLKL